MHVARSILALLLPLICIPVATAQWITWSSRPSTNLTQCILDIRNHSLPYDPFLVAQDGQRTTNPLEAIGTDYDTCLIYCGDSSDPFNWSLFSQQFTGWLLPFLALLAQLPYESDGTWHDFMSLTLTVGSPVLAMYSLTLTILNSRYLKQRLDEAFSGESIRLRDLKKNMFYTLKLSQQEPFQLGSLDAYPPEFNGGTLKDVELHWWEEAQKATEIRERSFTASLATQAVIAIIAFAFTWVDAFGSENIGTDVTAYGLAIALCWSWVTVIVLGWYFAGVSTSSHPISEAIKQAGRLQRHALPRLAQFMAPDELDYVALSRRIAGDLEHAGPLYNYAKAFVWTYNIDRLVDTLQHHISQVTAAGIDDIEGAAPVGVPAATNAEASNNAASSEASLHGIILGSKEKSSYRYYQEKSPENRGWRRLVLQRMSWSAISATVLVVSTVGAAFCLDYLTYSIGLGCRSGGVLIYWMLSYIVWMLMVVSAWISHHWSVCRATQRIENSQPPKYLYFLGVVAVVLRIIGKTMAILNSAWIVTNCLFEFTQYYSNCFCDTNRGTAPWIWLDDASIRGLNGVQELWFGLALLTGVVCTGYICFIGLWTRTRLQ